MKHAIPDDWDGSFCRFAICWPDSVLWRALLRGLISEPARGFFWDENTGSIIGVLSEFRPTLDDNLDLPEVIMACNDTGIANALNAIATAISNQNNDCAPQPIYVPPPNISVSCYSNSNAGAQTYVTLPDGTIWPVFGDQPIAEVPESGFPPGYEDVEQYNADKCRKANKIIDDLISSLNNLGNVTWGTGAIGAGIILGAIVGLITVPPVTIPLLLFALTANVGITALVVQLSNGIEADRDYWVCLLYQGENAQSVINSLSDAFDLLVATIAPEATLGLALKSIGMWLMSGDTLNFLFSAQAAEVYPDADCSCASCEDPEEHTWDFSINPLTAEPPWEFITVSGDVRAYEWYDPFDSLLVNIQDGTSISRWKSPEGCYVGDKFQVNLSAQSNPGPLEVWGVVHYVDDTEDEEIFTTTLPSLGTNYDMDVNPDKQVVWVAVDWRWSGITGGYNFSGFFNGPSIFFQA